MNDAHEKVKSGVASPETSGADSNGLSLKHLVDSRRAALNLMEDAVESRKQAESAIAALQKSEARHAFLLMLSDALRPVDDPLEVQEIASRVLGEYLDVDRVFYAEVDDTLEECIVHNSYAKDGRSAMVRFPLAEFERSSQILRSGRILKISNAGTSTELSEAERRSYAESGVAAAVSAPLLKGGRWVAALGMHSFSPREWNDTEIKFLTETAERTWDAVERARAEENLRKTTARLRETTELFFGLIENAPFGVYLVDADFRLAQVSAASQKVFENVDPLIGRDFAEVLRTIWPEPFATQAIGIFRHTLETGEPYHSADTTEIRADINDPESYDWQTKRITLPDGRFGVVCYFFDMTERRRAEIALRQSQERLQAAQQAGQIGVWDWETDTGKTYWSDTMWHIFGYDAPLESAENFWEKHLHPDDADRARDKVARLLASNETDYHDEIRILRPDGSVRWIEGVARITRDPSGAAIRMSGVNIDITDRRQAEQALRESEERLRLLTESFQDIAIFTTEVDGTVVTWNPGAEFIFGYAEEEIIGKNGRILFVPEDQVKGEADREMETARSKGRAADERWHLRKDGSRFYASGIMAGLWDGPNLIGYAKIARDLTQQKQAEEELLRQHEELESIVAGRTAELAEANDALREQMEERRRSEDERFSLLQRVVTTQEDERRRIARDMHDSLGQQLTALRLKVASMKTDLYTDGRIGEGLESLQELGKRIDSEVNYLVWELRPTVLDDLGLATAIENFAREWSRHFGIIAEVHTGRFGKRRVDTNVETNLYRILQEALNNIHKHADARIVNVVLESRRNQVVLVIEDDGVGFDTENLGRVRKAEGGLGLIGMRERAAIIGGTVEIESAPGNGTTVFVRAPIRQGD